MRDQWEGKGGGGGELSGKCGNIGEGLEERQKSF